MKTIITILFSIFTLSCFGQYSVDTLYHTYVSGMVVNNDTMFYEYNEITFYVEDGNYYLELKDRIKYHKIFIADNKELASYRMYDIYVQTDRRPNYSCETHKCGDTIYEGYILKDYGLFEKNTGKTYMFDIPHTAKMVSNILSSKMPVNKFRLFTTHTIRE